MYLLKQNDGYRVFDIISDISMRQRIISIDIMSKPFYGIYSSSMLQ